MPFRSVFCVAQTAFRFLTDSHARVALLTDLDCLALLLAAMCHDLEHPGTTNAFQVNTGSALAIRYNDASVLENHHAATGYALLDACGVLAPLSAEERRSLRRTLVDAVLATDMVRPTEQPCLLLAFCTHHVLPPYVSRASTRTC